jgi:cell division septation protein DedD
MKSQICLFGLVLCVLFTLGSCKSKESAYKTAYEAAKEKETQETTVSEVTPVNKPKTSSIDSQREKVTAIDGSIRQFSVVIGSFLNKTNATALKEKMEKQGFKAFLAQNEKGMYRVIVATYDEKPSAAAERTRVKEKYYPDFQDAWILEKY